MSTKKATPPPSDLSAESLSKQSKAAFRADYDGDDSFGMQLHYVRMGLIRHLENELESSGIGLNFCQYRVLKHLGDYESMTAAELSRRLGHDAGALTRVLDRLQELGHIQRRHRLDDRRATDVLLTEDGKLLVERMRDIAASINQLALANLSDEERLTLKALLNRIRVTVEH